MSISTLAKSSDLNDVAWSHTSDLFQEISGLLDPRIGRGFFNTFHARWPGLRFALDHCFHSNRFRLIAVEILPSFGSDHFPVFVALSHEPEAARQAPELQADAAATEEAEQRIASVDLKGSAPRASRGLRARILRPEEGCVGC